MDKKQPLPGKSNISEDENKIYSESNLEEKEVSEDSKTRETVKHLDNTEGKKESNDPLYLSWRRRETRETVKHLDNTERKKESHDPLYLSWRRKETRETVKHLDNTERKKENHDPFYLSWRRKEREKRNPNKEGYWAFPVDYEKNILIDVLKSLHQEDPNLFIKPPTVLVYKLRDLPIIACPTPDFENADNVRNVAKKIRESFYYPYFFYYYHNNQVIYKYSMHDLYIAVGKKFRKVIREEASFSTITDMVKEISLEKADYDLPSTVRNFAFLAYPSASAVEELFPSRSGKWMLYGGEDLQKMDFFWKKLVRLCDDGVLTAVKTSTVADERQGVVRGYTKDSNNLGEVKRAGDAIVRETGYDELMFYKTNVASVEGQYNAEGYKNVSLYLHAGDNELYVRDEYGRWKLYEGLDEC